MKKTFISLVLSLLFLTPTMHTRADNIKFEYDDSGNCVLKVKTVVLQRSKSVEREDVAEEEAQVEWLAKTEILIFPNPTKGALLIELRGELSDEAFRLKLSDSSGKALQEHAFSGNTYTVDMTGYPTGIYILQLMHGEEVKEWKIVKE